MIGKKVTLGGGWFSDEMTLSEELICASVKDEAACKKKASELGLSGGETFSDTTCEVLQQNYRTCTSFQ